MPQTLWLKTPGDQDASRPESKDPILAFALHHRPRLSITARSMIHFAPHSGASSTLVPPGIVHTCMASSTDQPPRATKHHTDLLTSQIPAFAAGSYRRPRTRYPADREWRAGPLKTMLVGQIGGLAEGPGTVSGAVPSLSELEKGRR